MTANAPRRCWLRLHRWSRWNLFAGQRYWRPAGWVPNDGQKRECLRCGKIQTRWLND